MSTFCFDQCSDRTLTSYLTRPEVAERVTGQTFAALVAEGKRRGLLPLPPRWSWAGASRGWLRRPDDEEAWSGPWAGGIWYEPGGGKPSATGLTRDEAIARAWAEWEAEQVEPPQRSSLADGLDETRDTLAAELSEATVNVLAARAGQGWHVRDLLTLVDDLASIGVISSTAVEEAKAAIFRAVRNHAVDGLIKSDHIPF